MSTMKHLLLATALSVVTLCMPCATLAWQPVRTLQPTPLAKPLAAGSLLRQRLTGSVEQARHLSTLAAPARVPFKSVSRVTADYVPTIFGTVIFADNWTAATKARGIYSFEAKASADVQLNAEALGSGDFNSFCGVGYDGIYRFVTANQHEGTSYYDYNYYEYSTDTWQQLSTKTVYSRSHVAADYTYDVTTDKVYGVFPGETGNRQDFATIDFSGNITTNIIKQMTIPQVVAVAADSQGDIYVISVDGNLYHMDKATGDATLVGSTGVATSDYAQSATFDPVTDRLYWACTLADDSSALFEVDTTTGAATEVLRFPHSEEITGLYIPTRLAEDEAPAKAENLTASFEKGSLTGTVSFTIPTVTFGGNALTGTIDYDIQQDGQTLKSGKAAVGTTVTEQLTLPKGGQTSLVVVLKNAAGSSPVARSVFWAGPDTPVAVASVLLSIDEETYEATLSWDKPERGVNGGYVGEMTYDVVRYPEGIIVSSGQSATTFSEILSRDKLNNYYYTVEAVYEGLHSTPTESNRQVAGSAYEVPFFDNPKSEDAETLPFYLVYNVNGDDGRWGINFMGLCYESSWTATNTSDDWLLTPPIHLKPGQSYIFSFDYRVSWKTHRLAAAFGKGHDYTAYTELMPATEIDNSDFKTFTKEIIVSQDTIYRFGFHALSDGDVSSMYINNISVTVGSSDNAPDSVKNLQVTPAAMGELKATLSFTTPSRLAGGDGSLSSLTKVDIYRNGDLAATIDAPAVDSPITYTDTKPLNGVNEYTVVATNEYGDGKKATVSAWVGYDQPMAPTDIKVKDNGSTISLLWKAPTQTTGRHGGYVDLSRLRYSVYDPTNHSAIIEEHIDGLGVEDKKVIMDNDFQSLMYYSVYSEIMLADGSFLEGSIAFSPYMRIGKPFAIPYRESVANGEMENNGNWSEANYMTSWYTTKELSADGDGGCIYFTSDEAGDWAIFHLPKLVLKGAKNPYFFFSYYAVPDADVQIEAQLLTTDYEPATLKAIDFKDSSLTGWQKVALPLADYTDEPYIILGLKGTVSTKEIPLVVDAMEVRDVLSKDLSASLDVASLSTVGQETTITASVTNLGTDEATAYTVTLFKGSEKIGEQQGPALKFNETGTVSFNYMPAVTDDEVVTFHAVVDYEGDENLQNNTTDEVATTVKQNSFPTATNVKATTNGDGSVSLTWDAPALEEADLTEEDFENYQPWSITNIGRWTTYDANNAYTYNLGAEYPFEHAGYPYAFIVMNPTSWTLGTQAQNQLAPHSGSQYLASFCIQGATSHWLISPVLSGSEQTVSFFAKSIDSELKETFEILYSTTGTAPNDFTVLKTVKNVPVNWAEYSADLPEGTKHFAIRHCSDDCWALCIDDVSYEPAALTIEGYRVYRDGQLLGSSATTAFTDNATQGLAHRYQVSVVYNEGESPLSEAAQSEASGIITINSGKAITDHSVYDLGGRRRVHTQSSTLNGQLRITAGRKVILK